MVKDDDESVDSLSTDMIFPPIKSLYCISWITGDKKGEIECQYPQGYRDVNQLYKSLWSLIITCLEILILCLFWILTRRLRGDFLKPIVTVMYIPLSFASILKLVVIFMKIREPYSFKGYWDGGFFMFYQFCMTTTHLMISLGIISVVITVAFAARRRVGYDMVEMWTMACAMLFLSVVIAATYDFTNYNWRRMPAFAVLIIESLGGMFLVIGILLLLCTFFCCSTHWELREHYRSHDDPVVFDARTRMIWTIPFIAFTLVPCINQIVIQPAIVFPPNYFETMGDLRAFYRYIYEQQFSYLYYLHFEGLPLSIAFLWLTPYRMTLLEMLHFKKYFPKKRTPIVTPERQAAAQCMHPTDRPLHPELHMLMSPPHSYPNEYARGFLPPPSKLQHNQVSIGGHVIDLPSDCRTTIEYHPGGGNDKTSSVVIEELPDAEPRQSRETIPAEPPNVVPVAVPLTRMNNEQRQQTDITNRPPWKP